MQRTEPPFIAIAICLAALAGFVDALAFMSLGGFFASFMSGNSTRLGVSLATGASADLKTAGALILSFVSGVILATVIVRARPADSKPAVMAAVTLLLLVASAVGSFAPGMIALLLLAVAMGAENGVFHRDGEVTIGVTYLTGSLVRMGQRLAGALMGDADRWAWVPYLLLWAGFVAGVVLGVGAHLRWGWTALWLATAAAAALTVVIRRVSKAPALTVAK
ncbi:MAG: YoaK family protein [Pseudomonadota bacterium]